MVSCVIREVYVATIMRDGCIECVGLTLTLTLIFFHFVHLEFGKGEFGLYGGYLGCKGC